MKTLIIALIVALATITGSIAFSTLYDLPAKADAGALIEPAQIMMNTKNLPAAHYDDYSVVFN